MTDISSKGLALKDNIAVNSAARKHKHGPKTTYRHRKKVCVRHVQEAGGPSVSGWPRVSGRSGVNDRGGENVGAGPSGASQRRRGGVVVHMVVA